MLGFVPAPKFLPTQILCRLYKIHSDETKPRFPCIRKGHRIRTLKILQFTSELTTYGNTKTTQHAFEVSRVFRVLKVDTIRMNYSEKPNIAQFLCKYVNLVLNVHRNHEAYYGEKGGRGHGGGGRGRLYTYRYTVTTRVTPALRCFLNREGQSHKTVSTEHNR